jgi:hypothetical protein
MAASTRALLSDLEKGHEFPPTKFDLTQDYVDEYLAATRDSNAIYGQTGLAPPLAVAARALGKLLEAIELPPGSLHTGQEVEMKAGVPVPSTLELSGRLAQRSMRAGLVIGVLEFQVSVVGETGPALLGKTTVMMPQGDAE